MTRLFTSAAEVIKHNQQSKDAWRNERGLGEAVQGACSSMGRASVSKTEDVGSNPTGYAKPLERDIQREIRDAMRKHSAVAHVFRVNSGAQLIEPTNGPRRFVRYHDIPGMSDLWLWLKPPHAPRQAFIEVKRPGEVASDKQAAFLEAVRALGHVGFVASNAADAFERLTSELAAA